MNIELLATSIADRAYDRTEGRHRLRPPCSRGEAPAWTSSRKRVWRQRQHLERDPKPSLVGGTGDCRGAARFSRDTGLVGGLSRMSLPCGFCSRRYALPLSFAGRRSGVGEPGRRRPSQACFHGASDVAGEQAETELWKRYDREFHQCLIEACGSQTLLDLYGGVFDQYLRYQMVAVVFRGAIAAEEHRSLLDCALERDCAASLRGSHAACGRMRDLFAEQRSAAMSERQLACRQPARAPIRRIRADIVFGRLSPGKKLKLEQIEGRLRHQRQHASRNPEPPAFRAARGR